MFLVLTENGVTGDKTAAAKIRERIARQKLARVRLKRIADSKAKLAAKHAEKPVERFHQRIARLTAAAKRDRQSVTGRWCILSTSSGRTLPLAESLIEAGFDAWTPVGEAERRRGRARDREYIDAPILPGVVFAREENLPDLMAALALPINPHPSFSVFVHCGAAPLIEDLSMEPLRRSEATAIEKLEQRARATASQELRHLPTGATVKVVEDPNFLGMIGTVESCDGRKAEINFGGKYPIKVGAWRLLIDDVKAEPAHTCGAPTGSA